MRRSQKFGPILNAYCEERGKRFLVDWNFVHWYTSPTIDDPSRLSGCALEWQSTPNDFCPTEKEPCRDMKDDDIIEVIEGRPEKLYRLENLKKYQSLKVDGEPDDMSAHTNHQDNEGGSSVQPQSMNDYSRQELGLRRNEDYTIGRLQLAYDGMRHAYEKKRVEIAVVNQENERLRMENQALLHEMKRLRGQTVLNEAGNLLGHLDADRPVAADFDTEEGLGGLLSYSGR
jgi:hypothetical protein